MTNYSTPQVPAEAVPGVTLTAPLNPQGQCFGLIPAGGDWLDDLIDWPGRKFKRAEDALRMAGSWNLLAHVPIAELLDPRPQHPDDAAIDEFATGMKSAMAAGRAQGKNGWHDKHDCSATYLRTLLRVAISKGEPLHVGNYAMMLFNRGERTASPEAAALRAAIEASDVKASLRPVAPSGFADAVKCLSEAFTALSAINDAAITDRDHFEDEAEEADCAPEQFAARKIAQAVEYLYGFGIDTAAVPTVDVAERPVCSKFATTDEYCIAMSAWRAQRRAAATKP